MWRDHYAKCLAVTNELYELTPKVQIERWWPLYLVQTYFTDLKFRGVFFFRVFFYFHWRSLHRRRCFFSVEAFPCCPRAGHISGFSTFGLSDRLISYRSSTFGMSSRLKRIRDVLALKHIRSATHCCEEAGSENNTTRNPSKWGCILTLTKSVLISHLMPQHPICHWFTYHLCTRIRSRNTCSFHFSVVQSLVCCATEWCPLY